MTVSLPPHDSQTRIDRSTSVRVGPFMASVGCVIAHHNEQPTLHRTSGFLFCTRNGKPPLVVELYPTPSAQGTEAAELRESLQRDAQSWEPWVSPFLDFGNTCLRN